MNPLENPAIPEPPLGCAGDLAALKARLFRARATLVDESPFLGSLVLKVPLLITEDPRVGTACVDGRGMCYFARSFLEALELPALRAVLLHEALHLALDAFPRCGARRPLRWNVAHDFAINLLIEESASGQDFLSIPEAFRPLLDPRFRGLAAEEVYDRLPLDLGEVGLGDRDCVRDAIEGMGEGEKAALGKAILHDFREDALAPEEWAEARRAAARIPERLRGPLPASVPLGACQRLRKLFPLASGPGGFGDLWFDAWTALSAAEREALRESWLEKLLAAAEQALQGDRGIGSLPGWAQKLLGPLLNPQIPWQAKLAQKVHGHLRGRRRTFSRPGRRSHAVGAVLPGPMRDKGPVGVFVDVSGSVGPGELGAFMGEFVGILQNADLPVRLITWDACVQEDLLLERPEDMRDALRQGSLALKGGGGTDPRCVMEHLGSEAGLDLPPLSFGVLLTDGYVPWPRASEWPLDLLVVSSGVPPPAEFGYDALSIHPEKTMVEQLQPTYLPQVRPADLPDLAVAMAHSGLALMLYGSPGIGKTALLQELGAEPRLVGWASEQCGQALAALPVVTLSAPELNVEDLLGVPTVEDLLRRLPDGTEKRFKVTRWATPAALDPTRPFVLFIDEPNRCEPSVRNALFQLITGRTTSGGFCLPRGSVVCMAGNRLEDRAGVRSMDTAFSNRCAHFELLVDSEAWLDWATRQKDFSTLVRAFLARHPGYLCRFDPASASPQQPTPRTWAGAGFALPKAPGALQSQLLQGIVGAEAAQLFRSFQKHADVVPEVGRLMEAPEEVKVPLEGQLDQAWILATALSDHLVTRALAPAGQLDPLGHAVGVVLGRLARAGFEEVAIFSLRRAWRNAEKQRLGGGAVVNLRFFSAIRTLSDMPSFRRFLEAMQEEGAA